MISVPRDVLGRDVDLGRVRVTAEMIAAYRAAVGDTAVPGKENEAPPTFCLALRRGMTPAIELPPHLFGVYGGHDLELHRPIRAGEVYHISGNISDVYEKMGRSGVLTVVVRAALIRDAVGRLAVRIVERQIIRRRPESGDSAGTVVA